MIRGSADRQTALESGSLGSSGHKDLLAKLLSWSNLTKTSNLPAGTLELAGHGQSSSCSTHCSSWICIQTSCSKLGSDLHRTTGFADSREEPSSFPPQSFVSSYHRASSNNIPNKKLPTFSSCQPTPHERQINPFLWGLKRVFKYNSMKI